MKTLGHQFVKWSLIIFLTVCGSVIVVGTLSWIHTHVIF